MIISKRVENIEASKSVEMAQIIIEMRARGENVISFNVGEPDFNTPQEIIQATQSALSQGKTKYSSVPGEMNLRERIAQKVSRDYDLKLEAKNISLSNGSKQVLYSIFQLLCNPGDEVIIPKPYWVSFPESVKLAGAKPVYIDPNDQGRISIDHLKNAITPKTKAIIINSPNNPTGLIEDVNTISIVNDLAKEHHFFIISDEAYEGVTFDNVPNTSAAQVDCNLDNTIIVQSFSKNMCMTGFRLGYIVAKEEVIQNFIKLQSHICGNPPPFTQEGALVGLENEKKFISNMRRVFQERRDLAFELCKSIFPQVEKPQGAFYLFPRMSQELINKYGDDVTLSMHILKEAKVALLPGSYFGMKHHLRICFATSTEEIRQGFQAIEECL